jgi:serine/threonine protein kinase
VIFKEISLHSSLSHPNVVKVFSYDDDSNFVYIFLELCTRRSLMELHKRRRAVTEPETRYFMKQVTEPGFSKVDIDINFESIYLDSSWGPIFARQQNNSSGS